MTIHGQFQLIYGTSQLSAVFAFHSIPTYLCTSSSDLEFHIKADKKIDEWVCWLEIERWLITIKDDY